MWAAKSPDDALNAAVALNYCRMSLVKITEYNDRVVLDEEYEEIINNVNLNSIKDYELIDLLKSLMKTLTNFRLNDKQRKRLNDLYEKKVSNAMYDALSGIAPGPACISGHPYVCAGSMLVQTGGAYASYRNRIEEYRRSLDDSLWQLNKESEHDLNDIRTEFMEDSWRLIQKYGIPKEWTLSEKTIKQYISILKQNDPVKRLRMLEELKQDFEAYPPYHYYYGVAAQEAGQIERAKAAFKKYEGVRGRYFKEDVFYSSSLMNFISLLDVNRDSRIIKAYLSALSKESRWDWRKNIFVSMYFINYGQFDGAKKILQSNVDRDEGVPLSLGLQGQMYALKGDGKEFESTLSKMLSDDRVKNQDILYLLGSVPEHKTLLKMKDQIIQIYLSIQEKTLSKDAIILTIPDKWVTAGDNKFSVTMVYDGWEYKPTRVTFDKDKRLFSYHFEKTFDAKDFMKMEKDVPISFNLHDTAQPLTVIGEMRVLNYEREKGLLAKGYDYVTEWTIERDKWREVPYIKIVRLSSGDQKAYDKIIGFKKKEIVTKSSRYKITENNDIEKTN